MKIKALIVHENIIQRKDHCFFTGSALINLFSGMELYASDGSSCILKEFEVFRKKTNWLDSGYNGYVSVKKDKYSFNAGDTLHIYSDYIFRGMSEKVYEKNKAGIGSLCHDPVVAALEAVYSESKSGSEGIFKFCVLKTIVANIHHFPYITIGEQGDFCEHIPSNNYENIPGQKTVSLYTVRNTLKEFGVQLPQKGSVTDRKELEPWIKNTRRFSLEETHEFVKRIGEN